ncbi:MAG: aminopeptidase [Phycisphaerae bacterium]|nr:aminopeptidase [Phycisphaerae bacterium]
MTERSATALRGRPASLTLALLAALPILVAGNSGCWMPYAIHAGFGELGVLLGARPISEVLAEGNLDEETEAKLRRVVDVREYCANVLGLNAGDAYTTFYDSQGENVFYNISACPKDHLEAYTWTFPIVGTYEYLGFFNQAQTEAYAEALEGAGYDVYVYPPVGYSTVGWFKDPLFSAALARDEIDLVDLITHELTHNTAYKVSNSAFNESLATFVGRTGTLEYLADRFGADSEHLLLAQQRQQDTDVYNEFWIALYETLEAFYARQDLTSEEKIAQREDIFAEFKQRFEDDYLPALNNPDRYAGLLDIDFDNAFIMINRRYNLDLDLFQAVYDALGQDLPAAIRVFVASIPYDDPKQYLRDWLADR